MKRYTPPLLILILLFAFPSYPSQVNETILNENNHAHFNDTTSHFADSGLESGTGNALDVSFSGNVNNLYDGTMIIDSSNSATGTVTLTDGWSGSDLEASVDSLKMTSTDSLRNWNLNAYHAEKWLLGSSPGTDVYVPDSWTLNKDIGSGAEHPLDGVFEINREANTGYGDTPGWLFEASWNENNLTSGDSIYLTQLASVPYRELYSAEMSFRYYVKDSSSMQDEVYVFVRLAGYQTNVHVFESGDSKGVDWLQETVSLSSNQISSVELPNSMLVEIGIMTDLSGEQGSQRSYEVLIDDIELSLDVRPFPEQVDLKANGTAVVGWTPSSTYVYEPDDDTRDAWDDKDNGLSLEGNPYTGSTADPTVGVENNGGNWHGAKSHQTGIQFPVNIPQGAVITSAFIEVEPESASSTGDPDMRVYVAGFDSTGGTVSNFSAGLPELEERYEWTNTSIDWQLGSRWVSDVRIQQRSPDLAPLFQNVISDSRWNSGNFVTLMLDYMHSTSYPARNSIKGAWGTRFSQDELPRIFIEYKIPLAEDEIYTFSYEKDIIIDEDQVEDDLTNFPVMVELFDSDLKTKAQPDADDIAFRMGDTPLDFEIEHFNQSYSQTEAHLVAWVKVPTLSMWTDTTITMMYGNPDAKSMSSSRVWDSYETVHHMNENPSGTLYDSTSNNHLGTSYGTQGPEDFISGQMDGAIDFDDEDSDVIGIGQIDTDDWASFTMSTWIRQDESDDNRIFSKSDTTNPYEHIMALRINGLSPTFRIRTDGTGGSGNSYEVDGHDIALGQWHHLAWRWSAADARLIAYLDGNEILDTVHDGDTIYDAVEIFTLGNVDLDNSRYFDGVIDEARLTPAVLSPDWIETEYNNQKNPSNFLTASSERAIRDTWQDEDKATLRFTTSSPDPITLDTIMTLDIEGSGQSLDDNLNDGTSYYARNGTNYVNWTANVLVSPPNNTESMSAEISYPLTQWRPTKVTNPLGQVKEYGVDWDYDGGNVLLPYTAVDVWGVWTIKFVSWNYIEDMQLGIRGQTLSETATLNISDELNLRVTSPWVQNARTGLVLTDPSGAIWHTDYNTTGAPTTPWYVPSFQYRMPLTVSSSQVDANLVNFPVFVSLTDSNFQNTNKVQADGDDIVFVQNGLVLDHETARFDQSLGKLEAWVRMNLSSSTDTSLTMYYGNPIIGSCESRTAVWANGYEAAWHLDENFTDEGTSGIHEDSTSGEYDGTQGGNYFAPGIASYAQDLDGTDDSIAIADVQNLDPLGDVLISGWFYLDTSFDGTSDTQLIIGKHLDDENTMHLVLAGSDYNSPGSAPSGSMVFKTEYSNDQLYKWTQTTSWSSGWHHFAVFMDADNPSNNQIYVNGADDTSSSSWGSASSMNIAYSAGWGIGGGSIDTYNIDSGTEAYFNGYLDEFRIATNARSSGWISTAYNNQDDPNSFVQKFSEEEKTSPEHTFTKAINSTAQAGEWVASVYYNDTGASVSEATGLYDRNFIVKHDSSLELLQPSDAVPDKLAIRAAGDLLQIEVQLTDEITTGGINGATVELNWSISGAPTDVTLDEYDDGRYGKVLNTSDLGVNKKWRVNIWSSHPYYNDATDYFELELNHETKLNYMNVDSTPIGTDFTTTLIFEDVYDGTPISGASIAFSNGTAVTVIAEEAGRYNVSLSTDSLEVGTHWYKFVASKSGAYLEDSTINVTFTLRKHYTALSVKGGLVAPYGNTTPVEVVITDLDTNSVLADTDAVSSWTFASTYSPDEETNPEDFLIDLTTEDWDVGTETVTLSVTMGGIYKSPVDHQFDVRIRALTTDLDHEPNDLRFPTGNDFVLDLQFNVSEYGTYYGDPIDGLTEGNFTVANSSYTYPATIDFLTDGRYNLTIDEDGHFTEGIYTITVTVDPTSSMYASSEMVVTFEYQPARSDLTANLYTVSTPYNTNVTVILTYNDLDRESGITAGTITSNITWISVNHLGDGDYEVDIGVAEFDLGSHPVNLTADANGYAARSVVITVIVTQIHTDAEPSKISIDMPVGNTEIFYIDFTDLDNDLPIPEASYDTNWTGSIPINITWTGSRYRVNLTTTGSDELGLYLVWFNFTKGGNYQPGYCEVEVDIRNHITIFNLVSAVEPTAFNALINISVRYYDFDNKIGIDDETYIEDYVFNETPWISPEISTTLVSQGDGIYMIQIDANQFEFGEQGFTVFFNWTGPVQQYENKSITVTVNIIGVDSELTLISSSEPTPYLGNMSYTIKYTELDSGMGISNTTNPYSNGSVFISVEFQGISVDHSEIDIWEVDAVNKPGQYSIRFNTSIFDSTGLVYMPLQINWSKGVEPKYTNRTDVISVRILPRDTLISLTPPLPTSYGENGSFAFTFDDVTGDEAEAILNNTKLTISINTTFSYSHSAGIFTIEFNTTDFAGLGTQALELNVTWQGMPFYGNRTNRIIFVQVIPRQTVLEYLAPAPTQYSDNVTFSVTWTDVTGTTSQGIQNANVLMYNQSTAIDPIYYTVSVIGFGQYKIEFNTTYYGDPDQYNLNVTLSSDEFYYANSSGIRQFTVRQRVTLLSSDPISKVPYNSSITVILNYQDLYTLADIGNRSGFVTLEILNGTDWLFTSEWKPNLGYYIVEIETHNQGLSIGVTNTIELKMSYAYQSPYYGLDTLFIEFELRIRSSSLSIEDSAETTPYGENATFTMRYIDEDAQQGIAGGDIHVFNGSELLNETVDYTLTLGGSGLYEISLNTSALGAPGLHTVFVHANWTYGPPHYGNSTRSIGIRVRQREANVEITAYPPQTPFLDNVTLSFVYTDLDANEPILEITTDDIIISFQNGTEITSGFSLTQEGASFELSIPSTLLADTLVTDYEINITLDWDESQSPYYTDDQTIVKITITNRAMSISLVPIANTPLVDNMTVEFVLNDEDTGDPITGVIVDFDCQDPSLSGYTLVEGTGPDEGSYSISFNTTQINETGTYSFDLGVKWNSTLQPFYSNLSTITLRGTIDRIYTSLQNDQPTPANVQYTDSLSIVVYFEDLDHGQIGIEGAVIHVHYHGGSIVPSNLVVDELGSGAYNITFDTMNLATTGPQTLNVTAERWPYTSRTITPTFTVTVISTALVPGEETTELFWKELANISVGYNNLLNGNYTPDATVTYSWAGGSGVFLDPEGDGVYTTSIDTNLADAGTQVITITAEKGKFATSITAVTLVVKPLPSEIIALTPADLVEDIYRGSEVSIKVYLEDTVYDSAISDSYVHEIYASFEGAEYALEHNETAGYYNTTIPGSDTILRIDFYTVTLTAKLENYNPASYQFKINLLQTETELSLTGETVEDMVAVYSEVVNFTVELTASELGVTFSNATVSWYLADTGATGNFTNAGNGFYWVAFNTTEDAPGFGIWGLSFKARPYDNASDFASSTASLSLTVKKIVTQVDRPPSLEVYWGWKGNVSFKYVDLSFNDTIRGAEAPYSLSEIRGNASTTGTGEYYIPIDTSLLVPDTYQLSLTFAKQNYQEATAVIRITVLEVPTEIIPSAPAKNRLENKTTNLVVPVGEKVDITFFYNDTDNSDGYVGGLENAVNITGISHPNLLEAIRFDLEELGNGYYRYSFDTTFSGLYEDVEGDPKSSPEPYTLLVKMELANRTTATIRISVTIIDIPTEVTIIQEETTEGLFYGETGWIVLYYKNTWHNQPVTDANLSVTDASNLNLITISSVHEDPERPGYYIVEYVADSPLLGVPTGDSDFVLRIGKDNTKEQEVSVENVQIRPTQAAQTLDTAFTFGTPISIIIIIFLVAYIKIWSVPKRLRQINGQIKSLEKGSIPDPIKEAKSRQHLVAELYNDTYKQVEFTKTPTEMPPMAIEVEVPELGELLMILSILTNLTPEELEEFKGDIDKMKASEKAAFVKEVIEQEAIRAAKREDKEAETIIEEVREEAQKRLKGEEVEDEETDEVPEVKEIEKVERLLLEEEPPEEEFSEEEDEEAQLASDFLSPYELEELREDLEKRGVPAHEIDTIIKQAERLSRGLVRELLASLDENKE